MVYPLIFGLSEWFLKTWQIIAKVLAKHRAALTASGLFGCLAAGGVFDRRSFIFPCPYFFDLCLKTIL
jgi:hypothetical protein